MTAALLPRGAGEREEGTIFALPQAPTLQDVSLEVKPGELVCIYGPTGCGKSSLLLSLLGEVRRLQGTVHVRVLLEEPSCPDTHPSRGFVYSMHDF